MTVTLSREDLWRVAGEVLDPEVPVLSVVDLGIVRDIRTKRGEVEIDITPTYSGCPAMEVIERDLVAALERAGALRVRVRTVYHPAWTTDWLSADARERLRRFGIAPPTGESSNESLVSLERRRESVACPFCGSGQTEMRSAFGATACKSIWYCRGCRQPFEEFKSI